MRIDLLKTWLKMFPYGYCNGINFQTCRANENTNCPYCASNVHCSSGNAAIDYYRELLRFMRMKPRRARGCVLDWLLKCRVNTPIFETKEQAIAAWNRRANLGSCENELIVRCENCKHYTRIGYSDGFGWCERMDKGTNDDFYCSLAERSEG